MFDTATGPDAPTAEAASWVAAAPSRLGRLGRLRQEGANGRVRVWAEGTTRGKIEPKEDCVVSLRDLATELIPFTERASRLLIEDMEQ
jgi:hypothetical protein